MKKPGVKHLVYRVLIRFDRNKANKMVFIRNEANKFCLVIIAHIRFKKNIRGEPFLLLLSEPNSLLILKEKASNFVNTPGKAKRNEEQGVKEVILQVRMSRCPVILLLLLASLPVPMGIHYFPEHQIKVKKVQLNFLKAIN